MTEDERTRRRRIPTLGALVSEGVGDIGQFLRLLPEMAVSLKAITRHTKNMDFEVTGMHAAVERLSVEVRELQTQIAVLDERMGTVADAVTRLEPHIQDVNLAVRPLRRARTRLAARTTAATVSPGTYLTAEPNALPAAEPGAFSAVEPD